MKKIALTSILITLSCICLGMPLSPEEALKRIDYPGGVKTRATKSPQLRETFKTRMGENAIYLFENETGEGFLVVSADDQTPALLGYSESGKIAEKMSPTFEWWLNEYTAQIEFLRNNPTMASTPLARAKEEKAVVAPLIKTQWYQKIPCNDLCPEIDGEKTLTGCVATTLAQVMKHYEYPESGTGSITYFSNETLGELSMDLSEQKFDWANMIANYQTMPYTEEEAMAVAYLMKACGYASLTDYGVTDSSAASYDQCCALIKYFNYDNSLEYLMRPFYSTDEWTNILYENLAAGHPVIYGGYGDLGGHSFICDGYGGDGYFHFNWGWGGHYDGYYLLDALNPYFPESFLNGVGFGFLQDAIINIFPAMSEDSLVAPPEFIQSGSLTGEIQDNYLAIGLQGPAPLGWGWYNMGYLPYNFTLGLRFEKEGENSLPFYVECVQLKNHYFKPSQGWSYIDDGSPDPLLFDISNLSLNNGVYKVTIASRVEELPDYGWVDLKANNGSFNYLFLEKSEEGIKIKDVEYDKVEITDFRLLVPLYYEVPTKVRATITNPSCVQLTKSLGVDGFGYDENGNYLNLFTTGSFIYTLNPGETKDFEWDMELEDYYGIEVTAPLALDLYLFDVYNNIYYPYAPVESVMLPNNLSPTGIATIEGVMETDNILRVPYSDPIPVEVDIKVNDGVLWNPITLSVYEEKDEESEMVIFDFYQDYPYVYPGDELKFTYELNIADPDPESFYIFQVLNFNYTTWEYELLASTPYFRIEETSGIENLFLPADEITISYDSKKGIYMETKSGIDSVTISHIGGSYYHPEIKKGNQTLFIESEKLQKGISVVTVIDKAGHTKSLKIVY